MREDPKLSELFPPEGALLLTGSGRAFVERLGVEAVREVVLGVLCGANVRTQTEPLTRRRIAQASGAIVAMFARGWAEVPGFTDKLSAMALSELQASSRNRALVWPAQWAIGLTNKAVQNVLRGKAAALEEYVADFDEAVADASARCLQDYGPLEVRLDLARSTDGSAVQLGWHDLSRLLTAIGSLTLALRGSDKSAYGKLFERLVLGSALTLLGFEHVQAEVNQKSDGVFWLSDSRAAREADATLVLKPGKVARFDIGFIGVGNSEISKDKLSRYERELEMSGARHASRTFIIVDRLPDTSRTQRQAQRIGATIIQMSMQYWLRDLAGHLYEKLGYSHPLLDMDDGAAHRFISDRIQDVRIQDFIGILDANAAGENSDL